MGTNYYALPLKTFKEWEDKKAASLKEAREMKGLIPIIEEYYEERIPKPIHIGKSSGGWDFLFNLNNKKYYSSKESLIDFLQGCIITNEYGNDMYFEEFWNTIVLDRKWNNKPTKKHSSQPKASFGSDYIVIDGLEFLDCEFS